MRRLRIAVGGGVVVDAGGAGGGGGGCTCRAYPHQHHLDLDLDLGLDLRLVRIDGCWGVGLVGIVSESGLGFGYGMDDVGEMRSGSLSVWFRGLEFVQY